MGYYSDVGIALRGTINNEAVANAFDALGFELKGWCEGSFLYIRNGVKWYDGINEVDMINSWLNGLDQSDYRFIRIGEEYGDIEDGGCFVSPFRFGVTREFHYEPLCDVQVRQGASNARSE